MKEATQNRVDVPRKALASDAAMVVGEIEIVHRPRHIEVGIGVEAVDEAEALIAQIALDLEIGVEGEGPVVAVLQVAAELALQRALREIGDVRGHAGHREALGRARAGIDIAPARQSGSAMIAWRPTSWKAMFWADAWPPWRPRIAEKTRSG